MQIQQILDSFNLSIPDKQPELLPFFKSIWNLSPMLKYEECFLIGKTIREKFPTDLKVTGDIALLNLSCAFVKNKNKETLLAGEEALSVFRSLGQKEGEGAAYAMLGAYYRSVGDIENALSYLQKSVLMISDHSQYLRFLIIGHYQRAEIFSQFNKLAESLDSFHKALGFTEMDYALRVRLLSGIGNVYLKQGKYEEALKMLQEAYSVVSTKPNKIIISKVLSDLANYYYEIKDFAHAEEYGVKSYELRKELGQKDPMITNLLHFYKIEVARGDTAKAFEYINEALSIATELNLKGRLPEIHEMRVGYFEKQQNYEEALKSLKSYLSSKENELNSTFDLKINGIKALHEVEFAKREAELTREKNTALSIANDQINSKNIELKATLDELTKARISRKAITFTIILGVCLFVFEEVLISPLIDDYFKMSILISITSKGVIALLLKPIEALIEKFMLRSFIRKRKTK